MANKVQFKAAELLIRIKHLKYATQPLVNIVIKGVDDIFDLVLELVEETFTRKCGEDGAMCLSEIKEVIRSFRGFSMFEQLNSDTKIEAYIKREYSHVAPLKEVLLKTPVKQGLQTKEVDVDWAYVVPFIPSLEQVLSCPEILHCVRNPRPVEEGKFTSPLDGCVYQNHPVVKDDPHTVAVGTYTDGVSMTDTAASKSSDNNVTFVYWSLLNIYPELRSTEDSIFLLAVVKTSTLKKYGFDKIMEDFVQGMNSLFTGKYLKINNENILFHGILLFNSADYPAAANLGGFKESHFAEKLCRQCLVPKEDLYKSFDESAFPLRCYDDHLSQVEKVEAFVRTKDNQDEIHPSVAYGINKRSVFMSIPMCDVSKIFVQDLMHTTIEGTLQLEICLLISHALERGRISLPIINMRIAKFSKYFGCNKPARIDKDHLDKRKLHMTASETLSLAYMLPFVLRKKNMISGSMESVCAKDNLDCYILRLELLDLLMSRVLTLTDVETIREMIKEHRLKFQQLYPGHEIPKMHFETHYCTQIILYGPLRYQWCFRYESKHSYFKKLYRYLRSVKDLPGTLSKNHQIHQSALMMLSAKGSEGPYLRVTDSCGVGVETLLKDLPVIHKQLLPQVFNGISSHTTIRKFKFCKFRGVKYRKDAVIISSFKDGLPLFGQVAAIYGHEKQIALVFKKMKTFSYERQVKAFKVGYILGLDRLSVMNVLDLEYHHHLPFIRSVGASYVSVSFKSFLRQ